MNQRASAATFFSDSFEPAPAPGWSSWNNGAGTIWEWGNPMGFGPGSCHSPPNCYATNLASAYTSDASAYLVTPLITIPALATVAYLKFWHWPDIELAYDGGFVEIDDGSGYALIAPMLGYPTVLNGANIEGFTNPAFGGASSGWEQAIFNISAYTGSNVNIRFWFVSDFMFEYAGWYIDDVVVDDVVPPPPPVDTLIVEWWNRSPATVEQASSALMMQLNLTADGLGNGMIDVNEITLELTGSPPDPADIANVELWMDQNSNDIFEPSTDWLITGVSPPFPIIFLLFWSVTTTTSQFFVVYEISLGATVGDWVGASMPDNTYITVNPPDAVSNANFPIDTYVLGARTEIIAATPDTLTVIGTDKAPATVVQGEEALMLNLTMMADADTIDVSDMRVDLTGTASDSNISNIRLYMDSNGNGELDISDWMVATGVFIAGASSWMFFSPFTVVAGSPVKLLITYEFPCTATVGRTAGAELFDETYVTVGPPDSVSPTNFPITSSSSAITAAPADVLTVTGTDWAPLNVYQGDYDVLMEQLTLSASSNSIIIDSIQIDLSGTGGDTDIMQAWLYHDVNNNGIYEFGLDMQLSSGSFFFNSLSFFLFPSLTIIAGSSESLLVLYDISGGATIGNTVGVRLNASTYITLGGCGDSVSNANFPIQSTNSLIGAATVDTLTVAGTDRAPATVENNTWALMYQLTMTANANSITVTDFMIDLTGSAVDADIAMASVYHDSDDDGNYDVGVDRLLVSSPFVGGSAQFFLSPYLTVYSGTPENLLILYGIADTAAMGANAGLTLVDETYVTVAGVDTVSPLTFPLNSGLSTIVAYVPDVMNSLWTTSPPAIDGTISAGEWTDAVVVDLGSILVNDVQAYILVKNDGTNLYIALDTTGDTTNSEDANALIFDTSNDAIATDDAEDAFIVGSPAIVPPWQRHGVYNTTANNWVAHCEPYNTGLPDHLNLAGDWGFGPSPGNATNHRMFEHRIPLALIGASPGDTIGFLASVQNTDLANFTFEQSVWPENLPSAPSGPSILQFFGDLVLATGPGPSDLTPPAAVAISAGTITSVSIELTWIAPADNGTDPASGPASIYDIRYSTGAGCPITDVNWATATQVVGEPLPQPVGTPESYVVTGLLPGTTYCFALKTGDEVPNWSPLSNSLDATTQASDITPPAAVTLAAGTITSVSVELTWTAPADNGTDPTSGPASIYDIRYSTGAGCPITAGNWATATQAVGEPAPQVAGTPQSFTVTGLTPSTTYCFALMTADEVPNWSPLSNSLSAATLAVVVTGNITGTIVDENSDPIEDVTIELYDSGDNLIDTQATDSDGNVTFSDVDEGTGYYVRATKDGYAEGTEDNIAVTAGDTTHVDIELETNVTIEGTVVDEDGKEIEGATVQLLDKDGDVVGTIMTGSDGKFKFTGVVYGEYTIKISKSGYTTTDFSYTVDKDHLDKNMGNLELPAVTAAPGVPEWVWLLLIIVIVIIVILIIILLLVKRRKKQAAAMPPPPQESAEVPPYGTQVPPEIPTPTSPGPPPPPPPASP